MTELQADPFTHKELTLRGKTYKIRELSAKEYDDCVKMATKADDDVDMVALLRLMVSKSIVDPKLTADDLADLPYGVSRRLGSAVNRLHFSDDEDEGND